MKNVFLLGDSIRFGAPPKSPGYGIYVKKQLEGVANVFAPDVNCQFAEYTLRHVHTWARQVDAASIDVIHWNNGLWDALRLDGDEPLTPPEIYVYFLRRIHRVLKGLFPNARILFASTTTVIEEWARPDFIRYNSEIEAYNRAACALMDELGVEVNDLYSVSLEMGQEMHSDWVHFNALGSEKLAGAVTEKILRALNETKPRL